MTPRTAIDCFAGAGGATQGLRDAGFDVVAAIENDPHAAETWRANHPGMMFEEDIRDVDLAALAACVPAGERLALLKACPPCQGFSTLRGAAVDEDRNDLVLDTLRLVDALDPIAVLIENVPGLRNDQRFKDLLGGLSDRGYDAQSYLVNAGELGVPQRRRRLVVIAIDDRIAAPPEGLGDLIPLETRRAPVTAGQALALLEAELEPGDKWHRWRQSRKVVQDRIAAVPVGGNRLDLPEEHRLTCHTKLKARSALASYGRVKADDLAPTMTTRCTTPACGSFIHPTEHRGLSIREAAAFQTFPSTYVWSGGYDSVERQIGNAVPVTMAAALGLAIRGLLGGRRPTSDLTLQNLCRQ